MQISGLSWFGLLPRENQREKFNEKLQYFIEIIDICCVHKTKPVSLLHIVIRLYFSVQSHLFHSQFFAAVFTLNSFKTSKPTIDFLSRSFIRFIRCVFFSVRSTICYSIFLVVFSDTIFIHFESKRWQFFVLNFWTNKWHTVYVLIKWEAALSLRMHTLRMKSQQTEMRANNNDNRVTRKREK